MVVMSYVCVTQALHQMVSHSQSLKSRSLFTVHSQTPYMPHIFYRQAKTAAFVGYTTQELLGVPGWSDGTDPISSEGEVTPPIQMNALDGRLDMEAVMVYLKGAAGMPPDSESESESDCGLESGSEWELGSESEADDVIERERFAASSWVVNPMLVEASRRAAERE